MSAKSKQLRQMFEAKKLAQSTAKVEHKLAQVTAAGELICRVCRSSMKNTPAFWEKHLNSAEHKATLLKLAQAIKPTSVAVATDSGEGGVWASLQAEFEDLREMSLSEFRALSQAEVDEFLTKVPLAKKGKLRLLHRGNQTTTAQPHPPSSTTTASSLPPVTAKPSIASDLPNDFFDSSSSSSSPAPPPTAPTAPATRTIVASHTTVLVSSDDFGDPDAVSSSEEDDDDEEVTTAPPPQVAPAPAQPETSSSELPVGFFDDKKVDKSMHEQRDFTKELAEFRQIMVDTAANSRQQQLEAHKQLAVLRQRAEEQDSKDLQERLEKLKKSTAERKAAILSKKRKVEKESDSEDEGGSDVDLFDTEGLFGWRSKNALDK